MHERAGDETLIQRFPGADDGINRVAEQIHPLRRDVQLQADGGVARGEGGQARCQPPVGEIHRQRQAQQAGGLLRVAVRLGEEPRRFFDDGAGALVEMPPRFSQLDAAGGALQQLQAERLFQRADAARQRRLRQVQLFRRAAETECLGNGDECAH
mgnify:CR=1 FL=1